ncbi:aminotransferase class V-fold PLP-dependent enzyme [Nonomuraea jabiensis]|uniref:Selenocysteine lyase/cysteine desulfurase n=1 Tax=Nonomuraea jabiensis TaxID=882448 RepID=A0A7W9GBN4_9ACTN|nr:aminotransferase class V-fold PLP-dependent enzyme [Nonomuraea jabiensis]MBB5780813.1 selenocysteine lyase/cysteine desulfurase [Nonomuraea jabiensis]
MPSKRSVTKWWAAEHGADAALVSRFSAPGTPPGPLLEPEVNGISFAQGFKQVVDQALGDMISDGHLRLEAETGGYEAADRAADRLAAVHTSAARLLNCAPDEIALVDSATRAWDLAFYAVPSDGLRQLADERVRLISITHVPTNGGLVNPAAEVGKVAAEAGALFLLDACQSAGRLPIDVELVGCDLLSTTGRKYLRAPRGTGLLYVRRAALDRLDPPFLDLHDARWVAPSRYEVQPGARRFENWEYGVAARLGLGAAIDEALA